jgi:trigger factor protein/2-oxoglutarate-Fe(II)-dependent oxygenase superfamily protein
MQPNPKPELGQSGPLLEILDDLIPAELHAAAWARCAGAGWYFGHGSNTGDGSAFWKMDLESDAAFDAVWEHARPRCEALAGTPLRVRRQYANGHTYGLGGRPHSDDGAFTLLYYPNPEWKDGWDGETVFFDRSGEISFAVRPRPNRFVFFDARTLHAGRAPSRACPALRVTVAYKLDRSQGAPSAKLVKQADPVPVPRVLGQDVEIEKISADGSTHVYSIRIPARRVDEAVEERVAKLGRTVSLPGFRPGNIPAAVLQQRYGAQARIDLLNRFVSEALARGLPKGSVASALELKRGADSGDVELHVTAIHLPDLPAIDFTQIAVERLSVDQATLESAGVTPDQAAAHFRGYLKAQVLDHLDSTYRFSVLPSLIEQEFSQIWKAAQAQAEIPADAQGQASAELRAIAERRFRLGWVIAEMARRNTIHAAEGAELEDRVIDHIIGQARVQDRVVSEQELRDMMQA